MNAPIRKDINCRKCVRPVLQWGCELDKMLPIPYFIKGIKTLYLVS